MIHATRILAGVLAAFALFAVRAAAPPSPALAGDPCYHGFEIPATTVGTGSDIKAMPCAFEPTVTTIPVGGTVTFYNGEFVHLVTGANQEWGSRDTQLAPNATVSYTFDEAGVYPYACALHVGMSGTIVVGDGGPALAEAIAGAAAIGRGSGGGTGQGSADSTSAVAADAAADPGARAPLAGLAVLAVVAGVLALATLLVHRRSAPRAGAASVPDAPSA